MSPVFTILFLLTWLRGTRSEGDADGYKPALNNMSWTNSLRSQVDLLDFLVGPHTMARETVSLAEFDVMMGPDPKGDLKLADTLKEIKLKRQNHGLIIDIPNADIYEKVYLVFRQFGPAPWVYLSFALVQGPNGRTPPIEPELVGALGKIAFPENASVAVEFTTNEDGPERGYTLMHMTKMIAALIKARGLEHLRPMLELSLFHISFSTELEKVTLPSSIQRVYFYASYRNQDAINLSVFMKFYKKIGSHRCFLNVPSALHKRILNFQELKEEEGAALPNRSPTVGVHASLVVLGSLITFGHV